MDAARPEPALRDLEAAPFAEEHIGCRHAHVLQLDLHVAVRRVVVAEHRQVAQDLDALRLGGHQNHRLLAVPRRVVGICLAHHDVDLAARIAGAARPPLRAIDHILIAVAAHVRLDVRRIRRGDCRLGHQESRADLALEQRLAPLSDVLRRTVLKERLHVAGIGRRAIEDFRRPFDAPHDLAERRVLEVGEHAAVRLRPPEVPQPRRARLRFQLLDDRYHFPALVAARMRVPLVLVRVDVLLHERADALAELLYLGRVIEVHAALLRIFSTCCQPSSAIGLAREPASCACALAAVPSTTRLRMPCRIAAMRNRLYAR